MVNNGVSFTAYLQDKFSGAWDKITGKTDRAISKVEKNLGSLSKTGKQAARSIDEIDKRLDHLQKTRRISVDTSAIRRANSEIKQLERERNKLSGDNAGGGGLGTLGKNFLIGAGAGLGIGALAAGFDKAKDATAKYQKFEAILSTALGSKGEAQKQMEMIQQFAAETPFQIDGITGAFVKLVNQGFTPSKNEMKSLGDLAASTGKEFDQLAEAILDAQMGEFERLKEFGIKGSKDKSGSGVSFNFKGKATHLANGDAESIKKYILSLGELKGVSGSMAAISATTGGQLSNLEDSVDGLWKAIGDRLTPTINSGIGSMSSMIGTLKSWIEVPVSEKLQAETDHLQMLRVELGYSNTSEDRRREILEEVKKLQPDIIDNTKSEKEQLDGLTNSLDKYIDKQKERLKNELVKEKYAGSIVAYKLGDQKLDDAKYRRTKAMIQAQNLGFSPQPGMSAGQQEIAAQNYLKNRIAKGQFTNRTTTSFAEGGVIRNSDEEEALLTFKQAHILEKESDRLHAENKEKFIESVKAEIQIDDLFPDEKKGTAGSGTGKKDGTSTGLSNLNGSKSKSSGSLDKEGLSSVSGGSNVKNVVININNLNNGGIHVAATTVKESAAKAAEILTEGLLTAVNDANIAAGN